MPVIVTPERWSGRRRPGWWWDCFYSASSARAPIWVAAATWLGIVLTSLGWRAGLALVFSRHHVRRVYERFQRRIEALFGAFLMLFGLRLALSGRPR